MTDYTADETGFYWLLSRYYDPEVGRFLTPDVVFDYDVAVHGYNLYMYCGNNPANRIDIGGMDSVLLNAPEDTDLDLANDQLDEDEGGSPGTAHSGVGTPTVQGQGYNSYSAFKSANGSAGEGKQWHHIVEQCQARKSGIDVQLIQNTANIIAIDVNTHKEISALYSSKADYSKGLTVRNWLVGQSYEEQYEFGLKHLFEILLRE